jgi:hypothetical protein
MPMVAIYVHLITTYLFSMATAPMGLNVCLNKTRAMGLNLCTLPSHTNHALQPLNVACFKYFKTTFKVIEMYVRWLTKGKVQVIRKIWHTAKWGSLVFKKTLNRSNICKDFQTNGI